MTSAKYGVGAVLHHGPRPRPRPGRVARAAFAAIAGAILLARPAGLAGAGDGPPAWSLAVHGGVRTAGAGDHSPEELATIRSELGRALEAGGRVLEAGGGSLDAVQAAVVVLEDSPWFNAGRGAVFTRAGTIELDASIMDGASGAAGAVAAVRRVRNPVALARLVMERTPHVLLVGEGADAFALEQGLAPQDPAYFRTERRWRQLQKLLADEKAGAARGAAAPYLGTVGAVARDRRGRLAAATSTGGLAGKRPGRVGDSPVIGAGTFADARCAVSATGHGEFFIRHAVAHDICARARDDRLSVGRAAGIVIHDVLKPAGGEGGVITMDARGRTGHVFNTGGMARGEHRAGHAPRVALFAGEPLVPPPAAED